MYWLNKYRHGLNHQWSKLVHSLMFTEFGFTECKGTKMK